MHFKLNISFFIYYKFSKFYLISYRYAWQLCIAAASSMPTQLNFLYPLTIAPPLPPSHSLSQLSTLAHMCLWRLCQVFTSFVSINNKITHTTHSRVPPPPSPDLPASNLPFPLCVYPFYVAHIAAAMPQRFYKFLF